MFRRFPPRRQDPATVIRIYHNLYNARACTGKLTRITGLSNTRVITRAECIPYKQRIPHCIKPHPTNSLYTSRILYAHAYVRVYINIRKGSSFSVRCICATSTQVSDFTTLPAAITQPARSIVRFISRICRASN